MENPQDLTQQIRLLSPEYQALVQELVASLLEHRSPQATFRESLDGFKREHPELLRLLAQ